MMGKRQELDKALREATAYHEAGHAIAAWRRRITLRSVSIIKGDDSHGRIIFSNPRFRGAEPTERWAEGRIVTALAGPLAQRRYAARTLGGWHGQGDFQFASELALRVQGSGALATA
jgi:ATP-dependent Zn protease